MYFFLLLLCIQFRVGCARCTRCSAIIERRAQPTSARCLKRIGLIIQDWLQFSFSFGKKKNRERKKRKQKNKIKNPSHLIRVEPPLTAG